MFLFTTDGNGKLSECGKVEVTSDSALFLVSFVVDILSNGDPCISSSSLISS